MNVFGRRKDYNENLKHGHRMLLMRKLKAEFLRAMTHLLFIFVVLQIKTNGGRSCGRSLVLNPISSKESPTLSLMFYDTIPNLKT